MTPILAPINPLLWLSNNYVAPCGSGNNGVLIVDEFPNIDDQTEGMNLVGRPGYFLFQHLKQADIERDNFRIHSMLSATPPTVDWEDEPWAEEAIAMCAPALDATINAHVSHCHRIGKTPVIVTLGAAAFSRVTELKRDSPNMKKDFMGYPFWSEKYGAWVYGTYQPADLMKGRTHLVPVLQFTFKRALEAADEGLALASPDYLLDPTYDELLKWVQDYEDAAAADPTNTFLAYDIETPYKQKTDEDELVNDEDGDTFRILRISFSYKANHAVSAVWAPELMPLIERLMAGPWPKVSWNGDIYDNPRITAQMPINGNIIDAMVAWHMLNSALEKRLGFVAPFYVTNTAQWKHLSEDDPAFYSAKDPDMTLQIFMGVMRDLKKNKQWNVFENHVIRVHEIFAYMGRCGVPLDLELRHVAETKVQEIINTVTENIEWVVPTVAKNVKEYKKLPKDLTNVMPMMGQALIKTCIKCGELKPGKPHSKRCNGAIEPIAYPQQIWARVLPFKISKKSLLGYQAVTGHKAPKDRDGNITFDEGGMLQLIKKYPSDCLYPLVLEFRKYQKLLGTYIGVTGADGIIKGGMPVGPDGRVHTTFTSNPSTLRSASQDPNLQNCPRPDSKNPDAPANLIRNLFMAGPGNILTARDYSGIEAVLVGYFAQAPNYIRLAKTDVHSYYTAYALNALDGRVKSDDLPLLSWDHEKLAKRLKEIKKEFNTERNGLYKHLVHAANFGQRARGAQEKILLETGQVFPVDTIQRVMDVYYELFPEIPKWHAKTLAQVESTGFMRNPFGYVHRFMRPYEYEKIGGKWQKKQGPDANKIWAFGPQSTAAGIIKEAMLRLYFERFEEAGQYMRLLIHDELFLECPESRQTYVDAVLQQEMERPIKALPLPKSYGMGDHLVIDTEPKTGYRWGQMA
jgi:uracil-DNA glycosylase family 4